MNYINYSYSINGVLFKNFNSYSRIELPIGSMKYLIDKTFPIAYDSTNPKNAILLILPKDFSLMNKNYPDSLSWVLNFSK